MSLFHGLSGFPITPTDTEGRADPVALRRILRRLPGSGVASVGLLGSTGGYAYLDLAERRSVLELALDEIGDSLPVIVGIGALRTDHAESLARHARSAGASGLLLAPVSYTPLTDDEVFGHFAAIARATDLPICIYNNPSTTHFTFSVPLLARLAALPGVAAVKMPLPAEGRIATDLAALRAALPARIAIGYSGDWGMAESLLAGGDGFFSVAAGLVPHQVARLGAAALAGAADAAARLDADFAPLWGLFRRYGSLRVMFMAAGLMGLTTALPPRPILPLPEAEAPRVTEALAAIGAI